MKLESDSLFSRINRFFYAEEVPYGIALVRIFLPVAALAPMLQRYFQVRLLYSTEGTPVQLSESYGVGSWLPVLPPAMAMALFAIMVSCLFSGVLGWKTRLSFVIGVPLYIYFNLLDTVGTLTKYSVIAMHLLLLLSVSNCGAVWSLDAFLKKRRQGFHANVVPEKFAVWPARLMQAVFAFVYFGAGVTKIQTEAFFSGEQMRYWMLSNWNYDNPIGELAAMWSPMLLVSAYITVVWEILFGFLIWRGRGRFLMLGIGAAFHLGTWLLLGLWIFPAICISGYLAFVNERDVLAIRSRVRKYIDLRGVAAAVASPFRWLADRAAVPIPAAVAWTALICGSAVVATEVEYQLDVYGQRGPDGPLPLAVMDTERALSILTNEQPLREKDKFFSFELGSLTIGDQLANRRDEFEYGEYVIAQCNLNPPHEDMWVECLLQDDEERTIENFGQAVTREMLRTSFWYYLGNRLIPGDYQFVLRSGGEEIYRRRFRLTGDPESLPDAMSGYLTN